MQSWRIKSRLLIALGMIMLIASVHSISEEKRIDCRRFVLAPRCRGISAKRDLLSRPENYKYLEQTENDYKDILADDKLESKEYVSSMQNLLKELMRRAMINKQNYYDSNANY